MLPSGRMRTRAIRRCRFHDRARRESSASGTLYSNLPYYLLMFCKIFFCKPYDSAGQKEDTD